MAMVTISGNIISMFPKILSILQGIKVVGHQREFRGSPLCAETGLDKQNEFNAIPGRNL
jgi:hypothetical protein